MGNHNSQHERLLMSVTTFSPTGMFQPVPYHHVAVGTGSRHVHVAGQIARDGEGARIALSLIHI